MTDRVALLDALLMDPSRAAEVPRAEAVALLVELARVQRALELMAAPARIPSPDRSIEPPRSGLLTVAEAAQRSRKSARWIRDRWRTHLPFAVKKGRTLLFPEAEFERWLRRS
jgi:helix-turn-helix protein